MFNFLTFCNVIFQILIMLTLLVPKWNDQRRQQNAGTSSLTSLLMKNWEKIYCQNKHHIEDILPKTVWEISKTMSFTIVLLTQIYPFLKTL